MLTLTDADHRRGVQRLRRAFGLLEQAEARLLAAGLAARGSHDDDR